MHGESVRVRTSELLKEELLIFLFPWGVGLAGNRFTERYDTMSYDDDQYDN